MTFLVRGDSFVKPLLAYGLLLILCFGQQAAYATSQIRDFEASIKRSGPDGASLEGKLFSSGSQLRIESKVQDRPLITLVNRESLKMLSLDPESRTYREIVAKEDSKPLFGVIRCNHELPCQLGSDSQCLDLGQTMVNGRLARRWLNTRDPLSYRQQWIDAERGWVLRSHSPGRKSFMNLSFVGLETLEGRLVEKWERRLNLAFAPLQLSWFWYDPALELAVREEWPGGYVQAITHIRAAVQPGWLFEVPAEYRQAPDKSRTSER